MTNETLIIVLGLTAPMLSGLIFFILGKRSERRIQSLRVRSELLEPVQEFLGGMERFQQMFADSISGYALGQGIPVTYSQEERRRTAQQLGEDTNRTLGILKSNALRIRGTRKAARRLYAVIVTLDTVVKLRFMLLESQLSDKFDTGTLAQDDIRSAGVMLLEFQSTLQEAHGLVAAIRTSLV